MTERINPNSENSKRDGVARVFRTVFRAGRQDELPLQTNTQQTPRTENSTQHVVTEYDLVPKGGVQSFFGPPEYKEVPRPQRNPGPSVTSTGSF